jgi:DNA-binding NtrC family response regulator
VFVRHADHGSESGGRLQPLPVRIRELSVERWGDARAIEMIGDSPAFVSLLSKLEKFAPFSEPVLITGESGSGKDVVAQALYLLGTPADKPFVTANCPQFQEDSLAVSELFGHVKGSYTGAGTDRQGAFEVARGGVLFLDEIGDLSPGVQAMLLRALSTGEVKPLGSSFAKQVSVRVIAATNRPLNHLILTERFRYDLFFRLRHFHIDVPPLRERGHDWEYVLDRALCRLCERYGLRKRLSPAAMDVLATYSWPGNVRQVVSLAAAGYAMADRQIIDEDVVTALLDEPLTGPGPLRVAPPPVQPVAEVGAVGNFWRDVHEPFMRRDLNRREVLRVVRQALERSGGSYRRALAKLGLPDSDYQKFMAFLRHHRLKPDVRELS